MEQIKHPITLDEAAQANADGWLIPTKGALKGSFKAGAEWKKEQDKELLNLARQLIHAYDFRHPDTNQLLAGYTNEEALLKFNTLYDIFSNA